MNYISEVAKMLGVEIGERFQIVNHVTGELVSEYNYYFTNADIEIDAAGRACSGEYLINNLIYGNCSIKKKPWKPTFNEGYYYIDEDGYAICDPWAGSALDTILYKIGNCYKTKETAIKDKDKWLAFYASDVMLEV